ncbi:MAG: DUF1127 domain-containing protein [Arenicellales bacterium]|nr:DUF1127 domain-containing protein [Arenicellales bacterium]
MNHTICKPNDSPLVAVSGSSHLGSNVRSLVTRAVNTVFEWNRRSRQRRHLSTLDDRFLRDMGISGEQARAEFRKPFWRP